MVQLPAGCHEQDDRENHQSAKDVQGMKKMCTSQGKLFSRKRSGNCAAFQRAVKDAIKRARFMAFMPFVGE